MSNSSTASFAKASRLLVSHDTGSLFACAVFDSSRIRIQKHLFALRKRLFFRIIIQSRMRPERTNLSSSLLHIIALCAAQKDSLGQRQAFAAELGEEKA
jgi:hypothetical protein